MAQNESYSRLERFLKEWGKLVENYPWGGVITVLHDRIMLTYADAEIKIAPEGEKLHVIRSVYANGDCSFECPEKVTERSFASAETAARYLARMQKVPVHVMMNWLKASGV